MVNRELTSCRQRYKSNVDNLEKKIRRNGGEKSNFDVKSEPIILTNVEAFTKLTRREQADEINAALLEPLEEYRLQSPLPKFLLDQESTFPNVSEIYV